MGMTIHVQHEEIFQSHAPDLREKDAANRPTVKFIDTIRMITQIEKLDIRTITMGISLRDCACESMENTARRVYEKIARLAKDLVKTGESIETDFGIPIVNKRISVTPIALVGESTREDDYVEIAHAMDQGSQSRWC